MGIFIKREIHTNAAVGDSRFICSDQSEGQLILRLIMQMHYNDYTCSSGTYSINDFYIPSEMDEWNMYGKNKIE